MDKSRFAVLSLRDQRSLEKEVQLATSNEVKELLLMQSVQGHAIQGHGRFRDRKTKQQECFPDTTIDDVVNALGEDPIEVKLKRQIYINEVFEFIYRLAAGEKISKYENRNGESLFRLSFLKNLEIKDPAAVLKGFYLGSKMDNYYPWRKTTEEEYGIVIGGGECIGINRKKAAERGMSIRDFARREHSLEEVEFLIKEGVLCRNVPSSQSVVHAYIRYAKGPGTSDDLAVLLAGKLYGKDAAIGVFLADAIDTWDKYTPFIHANGQDEMLGSWIETNADSFMLEGFRLPIKEETCKFIYTISESNYKNMISESQRYFLQVDKRTGQTSMQSHLRYIKIDEAEKERKVKQLEDKIKDAEEKYKEDKRQRNKACRKLKKSLEEVKTSYGLTKMHIGHINSGLTNIKVYELADQKYKEVYC